MERTHADGDATRRKQRSARGRFNDTLVLSRQRPRWWDKRNPFIKDLIDKSARLRFEMYIISDHSVTCVHLPAILLSVSVNIWFMAFTFLTWTFIVLADCYII